MSEHFPDLLRALVTDLMLILLLCTMAMPKYRAKIIYVAATAVILVANLGANYYFYRAGDYTAVFYVDLAMLLVIGIALKPLFADGIMQWCFSYITMINIYAAIVFLSYYFRAAFPDPAYGNTFLRLILFAAVILAFRRWVSKLYRQVLDYWHIYILPASALLLCFLGHFFGGDIQQMLTANDSPLLYLTLLGLSIYVAIVHSLQTLTRQYRLREQNLAVEAQREYLQLATTGMAARLQLMEAASTQNSRAAHDRRHFNRVLSGLLERGQTAEAEALLQRDDRAGPELAQVFCENPVVNAAVAHYAGLAEQAGIRTRIELDIPAELKVDALELSMVVANLLENAVHACTRLSRESQPAIRFICRNAGRLLLEMENSCGADAKLDAVGQPAARAQGRGIGSRSVAAFARKYDAELLYRIEAGSFRVRLLV
ncbi:GHKL domain-containing protein [Rubrivivax gelatinosus]|uniref:ATP-binding protein n=1 Tax=Rubrivivax gelatinosus TaxID=28068 RepID=A0ABS1DQ25_RUBGE|nr:ATP-binding protein [Rubrivivax gelatinosus]